MIISQIMAKKKRNKIVYIPNQAIHEKWWADDLEGQKQLHLERVSEETGEI